MTKPLPLLALLLPILLGVLSGCSGEPAPTVGDAEISRGIAHQEMPRPTSPGARRAADAYKNARSRYR